jgi:Na+-transporting methylmalonyl-CoA/oxaloacetate decarboxylase gamma subunit
VKIVRAVSLAVVSVASNSGSMWEVLLSAFGLSGQGAGSSWIFLIVIVAVICLLLRVVSDARAEATRAKEQAQNAVTSEHMRSVIDHSNIRLLQRVQAAHYRAVKNGTDFGAELQLDISNLQDALGLPDDQPPVEAN